MFSIKCRWVRQKGGDRRISRTDASHFLSSPAPPTTSTSYYPISPGSCYLNLLLPHLATGESPGSYYVPPTSSSPTSPIFTTSPSPPSSKTFRDIFRKFLLSLKKVGGGLHESGCTWEQQNQPRDFHATSYILTQSRRD